MSEAVNARKELLDSIERMVGAIRDNQAVQSVATGLENKGRFASIKGALSGANDKDLAGMVKALGGSLETTQTVVQVMLRLQTRKEHLLREFHSVLVDKIVNIQSDTKTLDSNQRAVALEIVSALQEQVEDQLLQYETIDQHELRLDALDDELSRLSSEESRLRQSLKEFDEQLSKKIDILDSRLDTSNGNFEKELIAINARVHEVVSAIECIQTDFVSIRVSQDELRNSIEREVSLQNNSVDAFGEKLGQLAALQKVFEEKLGQFEAIERARSSWGNLIRQHSIALIGVLLALVAIFR